MLPLLSHYITGLIHQYGLSAASHQLVVPSYRLSSYGCRAFSVAGLTTSNSLPRHLHDPVHATSIFACLVEDIFLFRVLAYIIQHIGERFLALMCYLNRHFTCLLTYKIKYLPIVFNTSVSYLCHS